jgi:hypothetical protein
MSLLRRLTYGITLLGRGLRVSELKLGAINQGSGFFISEDHVTGCLLQIADSCQVTMEDFVLYRIFNISSGGC